MSTPQWPGAGDEPTGRYEQPMRPEATPPPPYQPPQQYQAPQPPQQYQQQPYDPELTQRQYNPEQQYNPELTQPVQTLPPEGPPKANFRVVMLALAVGSLVSVAVGVYAGTHTGTGVGFNLPGFSSGLAAKSWLASIVFVLAILQVISSLMIYGKLPGGGKVVSGLHRWSGRLAVLVSLPVAAHCLYAFGFYYGDTRVLVHSLLGCLFYGIFVCKMLVLTREDGPSWALPLFGGLVFTTLSGLWLTSSLWFFTESGLVF